MRIVKPVKLNNKNFSFVFAVTTTLLFVEQIVGQFVNINTIVFATYLAFLYVLYTFDTYFLLECLWIVVSASLNILGNYACEMGAIYLTELGRTSFYARSFTPLVIAYFLLFSAIEMVRSRNGTIYAALPNEGDGGKMIARKNTRLLKMTLMAGTAISLYLYAKYFKMPYFSTGYSKFVYAQEILKGTDQRLFSNLTLFMPIAIMYERSTGKKLLPIVFFAVTFLLYFWLGQKFTPFLLALYLIVLGFVGKVGRRHIKRLFIFLCICIASLLLLVYFYFTLIQKNNLNIFMEYLIQRIAQQGEIWWSVYEQESGTFFLPRMTEFAEEIKNILPFVGADKVVGQWKMMLVSAKYSSYVISRVEMQIPFTCSSTASAFYYFGWMGMIAFYILSGLFFGKFVKRMIQYIENYSIIGTLVCVKLLVYFNLLISASDLSLISYKGILCFLVLFTVDLMGKKHIHFTVSRRIRRTI